MTVALVSPEVELLPDVFELAERLDVTTELSDVLRMTQALFANAQLEVEVYQDHELADDVFLAIVVRHEIEDAHELASVSAKWHQQLFNCCSAAKAGAFLLDTDWRP